MRHLAFARWLAAVAAVAMSSTPAQTVAPGPYYATPSWDQQLPVASRFVVLSNWNNEAVLDRETGLVWQRTTGGAFTAQVDQAGARRVCNTASTGGRYGWRLPSVAELTSLLVYDPNQGISLPAGAPFVLLDGKFWTSMTDPDFPAYAFEVTIPAGAVVGPTGVDAKSTLNRVWCVRGASAG